MPANIAKKLKQIRKRFNLTQIELAEKVGVSNSYIAHVEGYGVLPALDLAFKVEKRLRLKKPELSRLIILEKYRQAQEDLKRLRQASKNGHSS